MVNLGTLLTVALISAQTLFSLAPWVSERIQPSTQSISNAQMTDTRVRVTPPPFVVQPLEIPKAENAWALHIVSRGGFIGVGRGELIVMSDGSLSWKGVDGTCSRKLTGAPMQALAKVVAAVEPSADWGGSKVSSTCYDCYVTALVLQRRGIDSVERTYASYWDDSTQPLIPRNVMKIYDAFIELRGCKL